MNVLVVGSGAREHADEISISVYDWIFLVSSSHRAFVILEYHIGIHHPSIQTNGKNNQHSGGCRRAQID
jgi:phosphoribosylamine-glycine ligase